MKITNSIAMLRCAVAVLLMPWAMSREEDLTVDNFDEVVSGRAVLLQFTVVTMECDMCAATNEAWDKLGSMKSDEVFVGQVKCDESTGAETLCNKVMDSDMLAPYPSVWYGHPYAMRRYYGGKSFEALGEVASSLRAPCSPWRRDRCVGDDLVRIESYENLSDGDLDEVISTAEFSFGEELAGLEETCRVKREELLQKIDEFGAAAVERADVLFAEIANARLVASHRDVRVPDEPVDEDLVNLYQRDNAAYSDDDLLHRPFYDENDEDGVQLYYDDEYYEGDPNDNYAQQPAYDEDYAAEYEEEEEYVGGFTPIDSYS